MSQSSPPYRQPIIGFAVVLTTLVVVALALTITSDAHAQETELPSLGASEAPSIRIDNMGLSDGLSQGTIYQMTQDSHGYIWFGTQGGLHRYDGQEFKVYQPVAFDTTSLGEDWVWSVDESRDGSIWAGTVTSLERLDPLTGTFEHFVHDPSDSTSLTSGFVFDSLEGSDGTIWVGTAQGLNRMDDERTGIFKRYVRDPDNASSLSANTVLFLHEDPEGFIWASTNDGLNRIDPATDVVTRYFDEGIGFGTWGDERNMLDMYQDPAEKGILWVGTGWGLVRLNYASGEHERFTPYPDDPTGSSRNSVLNVVADPSEPDILWCGLNGGGLARFDVQRGEFTLYRNNPRDPNSMASDAAGTVFADKSGVIWVGYRDDGLGKFNPGSVNITQISYDPEGESGILTDGFVWAIFEDSQERLWISTNDLSNMNHLTRYDLNSGEIVRIQHDANDATTILPRAIMAIIEDSEGYIWVGSSGVVRCEPVSLRCTQYQPSTTDSTMLPFGRVHALYESPTEPGVIWVSTVGNGLSRLDYRTGEIKRFTPSATDSTSAPFAIAHIMEDAEGTMWLGTMDMGLVRFDRTTETFTRYPYDPSDTTSVSNNQVEVVHERKSEPGILWLAARGGLDRFDTQTETVTHFNKQAGLADNMLYGILEDGAGLLWMSSNRGISSFDPETEKFRNYGLDDGLKALEGMQNGFSKGAGGVMYFGNVEGISAFIPSQLTTNPNAPPVSLSNLRVNGKHVEPGPESVLSRPLQVTESIALPYSQNDFSIDFVALHFADPTNNTYTYRLEGSDQDWAEPGFQRTASYTNVGPGTYTFHVKAANPDGVWNDEGASLVITVQPPWWRTGWAISMFVVLLGGFIFGFDRIQRARLTRKERERAEIHEAELRVQTAEAKAQAFKAENDRKKNIERLSEIGKEITASLDFETIFGKLYEHINDLTDAPIFGVGVYNEDAAEIEYRLAIEEGKRYAPYSRDTNDKNQFPVWCIENKEAVFINDVANEYSKYIENYDYSPAKLEDGTESKQPESLIYLPLTTQDRVLGVITVQSFAKNAYTEDDLNLLQTMAAYASVALDNSTAYRKLDGTISELKRTQQQLVQQEKMASLGQLTAGVAHEIKNPLNFVNNFADVNAELASELRELVTANPDTSIADIKSELDDLVAGLQLNARQIAKHGRRADSIVRGMMQHTHHGSSEKFPVAINAFAEEYVNLAWHGRRANNGEFNVDVVRDYSDDVENASISPQEIGRVLVNLLNNAFDAVRDSDKPAVTVSTRRAGRMVEIVVSDNGPGVPDEIRAKIFEPFFTTKPTGEGTGLGLSLSHDIVTQGHDGTMRVDKSPSGGAAFVVAVPVE